MQDLNVQTSVGDIYARSAGVAGAPLVLAVHGWSQRNGWHTWQPLMEPLASAGFWVVSLDMPGWGRSQVKEPGPLSIAQAMTALAELMDGLGVRQATLMGKSWGGGVALSLALERPERVHRLILTAPAFQELDRLPAVRQPVLLAWSKDDPVIPFEYSHAFTRAIPDIELRVYGSGGHSAAPKNAADFAPRAIAFLNRPAGVSASRTRTSQGEAHADYDE